MAVQGNYDQVNRLCSEVANTYGLSTLTCALLFRRLKTLGYEVAEQLGWQLPDHIVAPQLLALFTKIYKGFHSSRSRYRKECPFQRRSGRLLPSPAYREDRDFVKPVKPNTIAKSIAIGNPADGVYALEVARKTKQY